MRRRGTIGGAVHGTTRWLAAACLALAIGTVVTDSFCALTHERFVRRYGSGEGLDARIVAEMDEDEQGFLWLGTRTQILRFDGREFVQANRMPLTRYPEFLVVDPLDGVVFVDLREAFRLDADGHRHPFEPPLERPLDDITYMAGGPNRTLWIADASGVHRRNATGTWTTHSASMFGARILWLKPVDGGALVWNWRTLWMLSSDGTVEELYRPAHGMTRAAVTDDGRLIVAEFSEDFMRLVEVQGREARELFRHDPGLVLRLEPRGQAVWLSTDTLLYRWHSREGLEVYEQGDSISGKPLLVDSEGSLWIGGFEVLQQLPEPRTRAWTRDDGLPGTLATHVVRAGDVLYTDHYHGQGLIRTTGKPSAHTIARGLFHRRGCLDGTRMWKMARPEPSSVDRVVVVEGSSYRATGSLAPRRQGTCAPASTGGLWLTIDDGLYRVHPEARTPVRFMDLPDEQVAGGLLETSQGELWLARHDSVCTLSRQALERRDAARWQCHQPDGLHSIGPIVETPAKEIWIRAFQGLFQRHAGGWRPIPGLPEGLTGEVSRSPRGGLWISTNALGLLRIEERGSGDDYEVSIVERLSARSGLLYNGGNVHEDADGTLWIASPVGVQQIPAEVRMQQVPVPTVHFLSGKAQAGPFQAQANGRTFAAQDNDIELKFASPVYRDRSSLIFRVRTRPDDPWSITQLPELRFVDLAPGTYQVSMQASLDGENWSPQSASFGFRLLPPWYRTWWAAVLFVLAACAVLYGLYRARVAVLLRLERQRTRIAMDLHDEVGSGLGGIGVLSGLLSRDSIEDASRISIARQIEENAAELGAALSDIVWSLRPRAHTLQAVFRRLENRANQLVPEADVVACAPDGLATVRVSLPVCKNVLSVGSEALHNAARHARPSRIELALERENGLWVLSVRDDGQGFRMDEANADGLGLTSMRRRAQQIDGRLELRSSPGEGTIVLLSFAAGADANVTQEPHGRAGES